MGRKRPPTTTTPTPTPAPTTTPTPTPAPTTTPTPTGYTFVDTFNTGVLSAAWTVSTWTAPQGGSTNHAGKFAAANINLSQGMLGLKLNQAKQADGSWLSTGAELTLKQLFGYGTYEWECRASSTATQPSLVGTPVSGSITGLFNYVNDSQTEIDVEVEGIPTRANLAQFTNWATTAAQQNTNVPISPAPHEGFRVYKFVWAPGKIDYYVDNVLLASHTQNVPSAPAYPMINHWGTNNPNWGGPATAGDRWMWVRRFAFTKA